MAKVGWFYTKKCKKGRKLAKKTRNCKQPLSNFEAQIAIFLSNSSLNPKMQLLIKKNV